jgi:sulfate permease, SulP family
VRAVGAVPAGLPSPALPAITAADLADLLLPAIGGTIVAYSDNVLTGRAFAARKGDTLDADQEMLALGVANAASGFLHGFPVSSSGSRTVIGDAVGGSSQLSSLMTLLAVVAVLAVGGPVLSSFPMAALGALVVYAALRLVDVAEFRRFARFRRSELAIALATTLAVLAVGVLYGVLVAVGLSILDLLRKVSRPHDGILGFVSTEPGLVVYRYDAPLCFANAEDFRRRALAALDSADPPARWL